MFLKLNESFVKMHGHKHDPNPLFVTKRVVIFLDHILTDNVINHSSFSTTSNFQIVYWQFHQIKAILVWYLSYIIEMFCRKLLNLWNLCLKGHSLATLTKFGFFDQLPPHPYVDIFYLVRVDKKSTFLDYLPTPSPLVNVVKECPLMGSLQN